MEKDLIREACSVIAQRVIEKIKNDLNCTDTEAIERFQRGLSYLFPINYDPEPEPAPPKPKAARKRKTFGRRFDRRDFPPDLMRAMFYQSDGHVFLRVESLGRPIGTEIGSHATHRVPATVQYDGWRFPRSHIIFLLAHGRWPIRPICHLNFDRSDDRIENLVEATHAEICRTSCVSKRNVSGIKGVSTPRSKNTVKPPLVRYLSAITRNGITRRLGTFATISEAHRAYVTAAKEVHGRFNPASGLYDGDV